MAGTWLIVGIVDLMGLLAAVKSAWLRPRRAWPERGTPTAKTVLGRETGLPDTVRRLLLRVFRFGVVGTSAALSQAFLFYSLVKYAGLSGFAANTIGYAVSVAISYLGQSRWTFSDRKKRSVWKFLTIAIVSFVLSSGSAWVIVDRAGRSPLWVLPVILLVIPGMSFLMMWGWAFRHLLPERDIERTS